MRDEIADDGELPAHGQRFRIRVRHDLGKPAERRRSAERVQPDLRVILTVDADDAGVVRERAACHLREPFEDIPQVERASDQRQHVRERFQPFEPAAERVLRFRLPRLLDQPVRQIV